MIELGTVPGGYGWVFPKGDHVNVGVGGWGGRAATSARSSRGSARSRDRPGALEDFRGYRLPLRAAGSMLARGARASSATRRAHRPGLRGRDVRGVPVVAGTRQRPSLDLLAGRAEGLEPYGERLTERLATHLWASWSVKAALDRYPADGVYEPLATRARRLARDVGELRSRRAPRDIRARRAALARVRRSRLDPARSDRFRRHVPGVGRSGPSRQEPAPAGVPMGTAVQNYILTMLDGGARVITEPLPSVRSVAIGFWIGAGSRDEDRPVGPLAISSSTCSSRARASTRRSRSPRCSTASAVS